MSQYQICALDMDVLAKTRGDIMKGLDPNIE